MVVNFVKTLGQLRTIKFVKEECKKSDAKVKSSDRMAYYGMIYRR